MDLQRRISRLLVIVGTALVASGMVAGALVGGAGAAPQQPPDKADHTGSTTTTSDAPTTTTRKSKSTRTTAAPTTTTTARTTTAAAPSTTTTAPTTTTTAAPTTTTSAATTSAPSDPAGGEATEGQGTQSPGTRDQAAASPDSGQRSAAQVGPTTSTTVNANVSRGPKSPVAPPQNPPPAAQVTSSTVSNPTPPAPVANPLPRTPVTALSGPPPSPVSQEAVEGAPPVGPPVPPWVTETTTPESESARQAAGAAAGQSNRRPSAQLSMTGSATRTLLFLAGIALLLGAVAVALGEPGPLRTARASAGNVAGTRSRAKVKPRTRRLRRTIQGWESGVPLAPTRRAATRARLERRGKLDLTLSRPGGGPAA